MLSKMTTCFAILNENFVVTGPNGQNQNGQEQLTPQDGSFQMGQDMNEV